MEAPRFYCITGKRVQLSDGSEANIARYGYRPWGDPKLDQRLARESGCLLAKRSEMTDRFVIRGLNGELGTRVYANRRRQRAFLLIGEGVVAKMPVISGVRPMATVDVPRAAATTELEVFAP